MKISFNSKDKAFNLIHMTSGTFVLLLGGIGICLAQLDNIESSSVSNVNAILGVNNNQRTGDRSMDNYFQYETMHRQGNKGIDMVVEFIGKKHWRDVVQGGPEFIVKKLTDSDGRTQSARNYGYSAYKHRNKNNTVISLPLIPKPCTGSAHTDLNECPLPAGCINTFSLSDGAAGHYDDCFRIAARTLIDGGLHDVTIRLGWEANLRSQPWFPKNAKEQKDYKTFWRRVHDTMMDTKTTRGIEPRFTWDMNWSVTPKERLLTELYPGDDYVDYITVDIYDTADGGEGIYPIGKSDSVGRSKERRMQAWFVRKEAMEEYYNFALEHDKPFRIDEWGIDTRLKGGLGGGDNSWFILQMWKYARARPNLAAMAYFDYVGKQRNHSLLGGNHPRSREMYEEVFVGGKSAILEVDAPEQIGNQGSFTLGVEYLALNDGGIEVTLEQDGRSFANEHINVAAGMGVVHIPVTIQSVLEPGKYSWVVRMLPGTKTNNSEIDEDIWDTEVGAKVTQNEISSVVTPDTVKSAIPRSEYELSVNYTSDKLVDFQISMLDPRGSVVTATELTNIETRGNATLSVTMSVPPSLSHDEHGYQWQVDMFDPNSGKQRILSTKKKKLLIYDY